LFKDPAPKDLCTLIRNIAIFKLNKVLHLKTAMVLSENGDQIFVLINVDDSLLKDEAERTEFLLQLEIGATDLLSLEPCDKRWRPYRFISEGKPSEVRMLEHDLNDFIFTLYDTNSASLVSQPIVEQPEILNREWDAYRSFLQYIFDNRSKFLKLIALNMDLKGLLAKELYTRAYAHAKEQTGYELKNIWNYFGTKPCGAHKEYVQEVDFLTNQDKAESKLIRIN
jgi:hypothetical protein